MKRVCPGMKACLTGGGTGTVVDVLIDVQTGEEKYVVLDVDGYYGPHRVAPISRVWHVDERAYLSLTPDEAVALPVFDAHLHGEEAGLHSRPRMTIGTA
ncbi:MAG TPA: hypothetical protein VFE42_17715 [Chloroflexota bacterium]|nr:hypothetical protein [Chloroflexota bacterium]